jgi:heptosyltransferase-1
VKILLVKTSSMGDVIHNLPVVSDLRAVHPGSEIDWIVEGAFSDLPRLHPGVRRVLKVAIRRWRGRFWEDGTRSELGAFLRELRSRSYDAVIDTQGLFKSALIARCARGRRFGLDWASSREPLGIFYNRTFQVPWTLHAVERNRALAARALGYAVPERLDYGISASPTRFAWLPAGPYMVLVHSTSAKSKLWPDERWIELARRLESRGVRGILPWGGGDERGRAERIAAQVNGTVVAPALSLAEIASLMAGAQACVGVDTGLTHLAGALKVPAIGIYCATDPAATGLFGCVKAINVGGIGAPPSTEQVAAALDRLLQ